VGSGGSSGNCVNTTPTTGLTRVWPGRKGVRRGTCLGARVGETGPGEGRTSVARGTVATGSNYAYRKAGKKRKKGQRGSSPQGGAPAAAHDNRKAARRRRRPRCGGEGGTARAARQKAAAAGLADPRARGGYFIGRPRGP
jgi:hypothetical protein